MVVRARYLLCKPPHGETCVANPYFPFKLNPLSTKKALTAPRAAAVAQPVCNTEQDGPLTATVSPRGQPIAEEVTPVKLKNVDSSFEMPSAVIEQLWIPPSATSTLSMLKMDPHVIQ
jgi:hypothetical protein